MSWKTLFHLLPSLPFYVWWRKSPRGGEIEQTEEKIRREMIGERDWERVKMKRRTDRNVA